MAKNPLHVIVWRQLLLLLGLFLALILLTEFVDYREGYGRYLEQFVKGTFVLLIARVSYVILLQRISLHYHSNYNKQPPHFIKRILQFVILFSTLLAIVVFVLNKSILSIMALGGIIGAGVALGTGPIILDAFSGLVHETERAFEIGDWLELSDKRIGKVISISWRTITLETGDLTVINIPQRKLSEGYTNYNRPSPSVMQTIEVSLDHTIPLDRAERLLTGAVAMVDGVQNKTCSALAERATEGGMVYVVRYLIKNIECWRDVRHKVLKSISDSLHEYNLKISETIGEYALSMGGSPYEEASPLSPNLIFSKVNLFDALSSGSLAALSKSAKKHIYKKGSYIVKEGEKGDSLFIVAEGVVEVLLKDKKKAVSAAHLSMGAYFGEMSLLTGNPRTASVRATTNCAVFEINKAAIKPLFKKEPGIISKIAKKIEERNKSNIETLETAKRQSKGKPKDAVQLVSTIRSYFGL